MALGGSGGGGSGGIKAGGAFVELWVKNNLGKGLDAASKQVAAFGQRAAKAGAWIAGAGAAGIAALGTAAAGTLNDLAKQGAVADALGLTTEQFTGMAGVAKSVGEDTREFVESLVTLGKLGTDAAAGTEQASQAFASLGLNAGEFIKLRADEQFFKYFDALNKMSDPLQRTRALMQGFGEDGGKFLLPLLGKSSDELRRMAKGFEISSQDMKAATEASLAYSEAGAQIRKVWETVVIAFAPVIKGFAESLGSGVATVKEFLAANQGVVVGTGLAVAGLTAVAVGMMALGPITSFVAATWTGATTVMGLAWSALTGIVATGQAIMTGGLTAIAAVVVAIPAGLVVAGAAWLAFTTEGRNAVKGWAAAVRESLGPTIDNLTAGWKAAVDAVSRGDFTSAFKVGVATIKVEWLRLTQYLERLWMEMTNKIQNTWDGVTAGLRMQVKMAQALGIIPKEPPPPAPGQPGGPGGPAPEPNMFERFLGQHLGMLPLGAQKFVDLHPEMQAGKDNLDAVLKPKMDKLRDEIGKAVVDVGHGAVNKQDAFDKEQAARRDEQEAALQQALNEAKAIRFVSNAKGVLGDWSKWLGGGWADAKRLLTPNNLPPDVAAQAGEVRAALGGDATRNFFAGSGESPAVRVGNRIDSKVGDVVKLLSRMANRFDEIGAGEGFEIFTEE